MPPATRWSSRCGLAAVGVCAPTAAVPTFRTAKRGLWEQTGHLALRQSRPQSLRWRTPGRELQSQGWHCRPPARRQRGWVVQVQVVDGHPVRPQGGARAAGRRNSPQDMGTPAGAARSEAAAGIARRFSPMCCTTASGCARSWRATSSTTCRMRQVAFRAAGLPPDAGCGHRSRCTVKRTLSRAPDLQGAEGAGPWGAVNGALAADESPGVPPISVAEILSRYNPASFSASFCCPPASSLAHANRPHSFGEPVVRRADGRRYRPAVPPAVQGVGRGLCGEAMVTSRKDLWNSLKTSRRGPTTKGSRGPLPCRLRAPSADDGRGGGLQRGTRRADHRFINMGCPAKKVCNKWAGSALMQNSPGGGDYPLPWSRPASPATCPSLKMRTGWCQQHKNAVRWRASSRPGIQMLTVHGRTREQGYRGHAEYDTIAAVKAAVKARGRQRRHHPPEKARDVLAATGDARSWMGPRCPGPTVDLPRDRPLSGHGRTPGATAGGRGAPPAAGPPASTTSLYGELTGCAVRASTLAGTGGVCRGRGFLGTHHHDRRPHHAMAGRGRLPGRPWASRWTACLPPPTWMPNTEEQEGLAA